MATPTPTARLPSSDDLTYELTAEYDGLSTELKKYFDTKQDDFLKKAKESHSRPANYETDRGEFLVNQQISNVNTYRTDVWNYLTNEFNSNTHTKYVNAKAIEQNRKTMERKKKELKKMEDEFNSFKSNSSTNNRQREIVLYEYHRRNDQLFIMKVISIVLLVCIILTVLIDVLLPYEVMYLSLIIFTGLLFYVIYYLYFKNLGRSKRYWDKYEFPNPPQDFDKIQSLSNVQIDDVDKKLDKSFDKYLDDCRKNPKSTTAPTPTFSA
jgi:hypothetical protein